MKKLISCMCLVLCMLLFLSSSGLATGPNNPPNPPEIEGDTNGNINEPYEYTFTLTDPDGDLLFNLEINWGDGTETVDCGCDQSWQNGTVVMVSHVWKRQGTYEVTARIQDEFGVYSEWSDPLSITMPKQQAIPWLPHWVTQRFPLISFILSDLVFG